MFWSGSKNIFCPVNSVEMIENRKNMLQLIFVLLKGIQIKSKLKLSENSWIHRVECNLCEMHLNCFVHSVSKFALISFFIDCKKWIDTHDFPSAGTIHQMWCLSRPRIQIFQRSTLIRWSIPFHTDILSRWVWLIVHLLPAAEESWM